MPVVFLERLPLPSLRLYTSISVVLLSLAVYYASHMEHNFHQQTSFVSTTTKETHIPISEDNNRKEILGDKLSIQELHGDVSTDEAHAVPNENEKVITTTTSSNNKLNVEFQHILSDNNELFATNETVQILKNDFLESSDRDDNAEGHIIESTESDVQNHQESLMTPRDYIVNGENMDDDSPYLLRLVYSLLSEGWCIWVLINTSYCCLILLGKIVQKAVFGTLRVSEQQHLKDKLWNYVFYNFIFVFGVMNVQSMTEVVAWCAWFSVLIFFHLLSTLCRDRFEYLSFSPTTPRWTHFKVLSLLAIIFVSCLGLLLACVVIAMYASVHTFLFMIAECLLLILKTIHTIVRYAIHLWYLYHDSVWENRSIYVYYAELIFELTSLAVDFVHNMHMVLYGNIFLSMASLVICMQLRYLFQEFQRRIRRHKNYRRVVSNMEARFPMASPENLSTNGDDCAICWDKMENARKLPCGHLFHNSCLRSWLEQDTSCPTCRTSLSDGQPRRDINPLLVPPNIPPQPHMPAPPTPQNQTTNHFFHFDGSRYVSWLPSFSVEVTHTQMMGEMQRQQIPGPNSQYDNMARQVQSVFLNFPLATIIEDLHVTHSVEVTIENILEERLVAPPNAQPPPSQTSVDGNLPSTSTTTDTASDPTSTQQTEDSEESVNDSQQTANNQDSVNDSYQTTSREPPAQPAVTIEPPTVTPLSAEPTVSQHAEKAISLTVTGSRFSKSSSERQTMLADRKQLLLQQAKRRFISKQNQQGSSPADNARTPTHTTHSSKHDLEDDNNSSNNVHKPGNSGDSNERSIVNDCNCGEEAGSDKVTEHSSVTNALRRSAHEFSSDNDEDSSDSDLEHSSMVLGGSASSRNHIREMAYKAAQRRMDDVS